MGSRRINNSSPGVMSDCHGELKCYGTSDLLLYVGILNELERRGFEVEEVTILKIQKDDKSF